MAQLTPKPIYRPTKKVAEKRERQAGKSGKHPGRRTKKVNL
jgi:hypothetical protein